MLRVSPGRLSMPRGKAANHTSDQARDYEGQGLHSVTYHRRTFAVFQCSVSRLN